MVEHQYMDERDYYVGGEVSGTIFTEERDTKRERESRRFIVNKKGKDIQSGPNWWTNLGRDMIQAKMRGL